MNRLIGSAVIAASLLVGVGLSSARAEITYTKELGGSGGGHFEDSCKSGDFLIGFNYTAGKALNTVAPVCMAVRDGKWVGGEYARRTWGQPAEHIGVAFGEADPQSRCLRNQYVTALHVWWDKFGIVHHVRVVCHNVSRSKKSDYYTHNQGGEPSYDGSAPCPTGQFAIGMIGGYGALIDRVGLKCQVLAP